jgi:hypothetical protein
MGPNRKYVIRLFGGKEKGYTFIERDSCFRDGAGK